MGWGDYIGPSARHSGWDFAHHRIFFNFSDDGAEETCYPAPRNVDANGVWQGIPADIGPIKNKSMVLNNKNPRTNILAADCLACARNRRLGVATFQTQAVWQAQRFPSRPVNTSCSTSGRRYKIENTSNHPSWMTEPILTNAWGDPAVQSVLRQRQDGTGALLCPVSALARMFTYGPRSSINAKDFLSILPLLDRHRWGPVVMRGVPPANGDPPAPVSSRSSADTDRMIHELEYYVGVREQTAREYVREMKTGPPHALVEGAVDVAGVDDVAAALPADVARELAKMKEYSKWKPEDFEQMVDHYFVHGKLDADFDDHPDGAASVLNCLARQRIYGEHVNERENDMIHRYHSHLLMLAVLYACAGKVPASTVRFLWDEDVVYTPWPSGNWTPHTVSSWRDDIPCRSTDDDLSVLWNDLHCSKYNALGPVVTEENAPYFDIQSLRLVIKSMNRPRLEQAGLFLETGEHQWLRCMALCLRRRATISKKPKKSDVEAPAKLRRMAASSEMQELYRTSYENLALALEREVEFRGLMEFLASAPADILGVVRDFLVDGERLEADLPCLAAFQIDMIVENRQDFDMRNPRRQFPAPWRALAGFPSYLNREQFIGYWSAAGTHFSKRHTPQLSALGEELEHTLRAPFVDFGITEHSLILGIGISSALREAGASPAGAAAAARSGPPPSGPVVPRLVELLGGYCGVPSGQVFLENLPVSRKGNKASTFEKFEEALPLAIAVKTRSKEARKKSFLNLQNESSCVRNHFIVLGRECVLQDGKPELEKATQALLAFRSAIPEDVREDEEDRVEDVSTSLAAKEKYGEICQEFDFRASTCSDGLRDLLERSTKLVVDNAVATDLNSGKLLSEKDGGDVDSDGDIFKGAGKMSSLQGISSGFDVFLASGKKVPPVPVYHNVYVVTESEFLFRIQDHQQRGEEQDDDDLDPFGGRLEYSNSPGPNSSLLQKKLDSALVPYRTNIVGRCGPLLEEDPNSLLEHQLVEIGLLRERNDMRSAAINAAVAAGLSLHLSQEIVRTDAVAANNGGGNSAEPKKTVAVPKSKSMKSKGAAKEAVKKSGGKSVKKSAGGSGGGGVKKSGGGSGGGAASSSRAKGDR